MCKKNVRNLFPNWKSKWIALTFKNLYASLKIQSKYILWPKIHFRITCEIALCNCRLSFYLKKKPYAARALSRNEFFNDFYLFGYTTMQCFKSCSLYNMWNAICTLCAHWSRDFWLERSSVICRSLSNRLLFSILLVRNWTGGEQCSRCACTLHNKSELNWIECIAEFPSKRLIAAQKQTTTLFEMAIRRYTGYGNLFN